MTRIIVAGHIALDTIQWTDRALRSLGGAPCYAGLTALRLGADVTVITKVGPDLGDELLTWLSRNGISLSSSDISKKNTTRFRITYTDGERTMHLTARCEDIEENLLQKVHGDALLVSPIANEVKLSSLYNVQSFNHVVLDLQGFLRVFGSSGETRMSKVDIRTIPESFLLKMNQAELYALSGTSDLSASVRMLIDSRRQSAVTLGDQGAILIEHDAVKLIRPVVPTVTEPTGLGDIFSGALAVGWAQTGDLLHAAKLGVAAASVSRGEGVAKIPSKDDVIAQMERLIVKNLG